MKGWLGQRKRFAPWLGVEILGIAIELIAQPKAYTIDAVIVAFLFALGLTGIMVVA